VGGEFPSVQTDGYIIMPNHFHGIISNEEELNHIRQYIAENPLKTADAPPSTSRIKKLLQIFAGTL